MTNRERFQRILNFQPVDRMPVVEWAFWWDKTIARWHTEGLPAEIADVNDIRAYFGHDPLHQYWINATGPDMPASRYAGHWIESRADYESIRPYLYPENAFDKDMVREWAERQKTGELAVWMSLEGPFWYPRRLFGIEPHMYAFYDHADLMKEINEDLLAYNTRVYNEFSDICVPDFMTFAEDMSYNHGPMLSKSQFDEFMAPHYEGIVPLIRERGTIPFVDTDGDVTIPATWFEGVGIQGLLPLERMAGVDVSQLRRDHPELRMIGAFDKTVMHLGEDRIRQEFERLLPTMRQGGFIASVDHQTPPGVSFDQYKVYMKVLFEYAARIGA